MANATEVFPQGSDGEKEVHHLLSNAMPELKGVNIILMFAILLTIMLKNRSETYKLDFIEYFSGRARITASCLQKGLQAKCFDARYQAKHNVLTNDGFRMWLLTLLQLKDGGFIWLAPVCSSWSGLCRHQSQRSKTRPLGDQSKKFVNDGNKMMLRSLVLAVLAWLGGANFSIEAPVASVLQHVFWAERIFSLTRCQKTVVWMGSYGGRSPKLSAHESVFQGQQSRRRDVWFNSIRFDSHFNHS